jgi:hypothetical protein
MSRSVCAAGSRASGDAAGNRKICVSGRITGQQGGDRARSAHFFKDLQQIGNVARISRFRLAGAV